MRKFIINLQKNLSRRNKIVYEKCVLCGADTEIPITMPIEEREDYIQGCGQLCATCRRKIHRGSPYIE